MNLMLPDISRCILEADVTFLVSGKHSSEDKDTVAQSDSDKGDVTDTNFTQYTDSTGVLICP